jgi:hypothetical protein
MLFVLISTAWLLIMALFVAVCHAAARGDAVLDVQLDAAKQGDDAVRVRRRGAGLLRTRVKSWGSGRRARVARSGALMMSGGERQP